MAMRSLLGIVPKKKKKEYTSSMTFSEFGMSDFFIASQPDKQPRFYRDSSGQLFDNPKSQITGEAFMKQYNEFITRKRN